MSNGLLLPGWFCPSCRVFNGEAKAQRSECYACGASRPSPPERGVVERFRSDEILALLEATSALESRFAAVVRERDYYHAQCKELQGRMSEMVLERQAWRAEKVKLENMVAIAHAVCRPFAREFQSLSELYKSCLDLRCRLYVECDQECEFVNVGHLRDAWMFTGGSPRASFDQGSGSGSGTK